MIELWEGDVDCVVFLQTIEHVQDPDAVLARIRELIGRDGVAYVSTPNVLTLAPEGEERSGNPWHVKRVPRRGVPRAVRAPLRLRRAARPVPRPQAARPPARHRAPRLGLGPRRGCGITKPFYDRFTPGDLRARLRAAADATSTARWTSSRSCGRERPPQHRPAHPHALRGGLRDVAVRRGVAVGGDGDLLPAAARRARRAPGARDAVADAGAVRPARGAGRARALPRVPARAAARDPPRATSRRRRIPRSRASSSAPRRCYAAAADRFEARGGDLRRARSRRTPRGPRRPPTPCCRCWPPRPACGCSWGRGSPRTASASAHWGGGLWLPECGHAPWLDPLLEEAGVHAACVDLTDVLGHGDAAQLRPLRSDAGAAAGADRPRADGPRVAHERLPVARRRTATRAATPSTATRRGRSTARPTTPRARPSRSTRTRATSPPRRRARLEGGGLAVCALDTELLGHFWHEGVDWLAAVVEACDAAGVELVALDAALREAEAVPAPAELPATSWGEPRDLATWSAPAGRRAGVAGARGRAARARRAGGIRARARCASCWRCRPPTGRSASPARPPGRTRGSAPTGTPPSSRGRSPIRPGSVPRCATLHLHSTCRTLDLRVRRCWRDRAAFRGVMCL